jgi:pyruvate, water dikinase
VRIFIFYISLIFCAISINANAQNNYFRYSIEDSSQYAILRGKPLTDLYTNVQSVKIVYDIASKQVYYVNSKSYPFHHNFCVEVLQYEMDIADFNAINYTMHPERKFVLACINYYLDSKQYILEFVSEDSISADLLNVFYKNICSTFKPALPKLLLNNQNLLQLNKASIEYIYTITPDQLYGGQQKQSLVQGNSYGYLNFVENLSKQINDVRRNDIIIIHGNPLALPLCKGVISDALQTPLSHINVLCNNRKTPAAAWINIFNDSTIKNWQGKPVKLTVTKNSVLIEPCSESAITSAIKNTVKRNIVSDANYNTINLFTPSVKPSAKNIGNKAMGVWHLQKIQAKHSNQFDVPQGAFAIPFYYYKQHLQHKNIQTEITQLQNLLKSKNVNNAAVNIQLKAIRKAIKDVTLDPTLLRLVTSNIKSNTASFRFRSSSNAEDLPGFNGAGLYASYSGKLNDTAKPIAQAIKKVWASVWSEAAFWEREYFNINQSSVLMAVLVHQGFPDEESNGVAITKNLLRDDFPGYTINAQYGEVSVVAPPAGVICDQFLIIPSDYFIGEEGKTYAQYITKSSMAKDNSTVLNPKQVQQLYDALTTVKDYFYNIAARTGKAGSYDNFGLDLEFKFKGDKLILKQVRPFK